MAEKDNDEEKFDDDEDFGLPELHYEELDDDSDSSSDEDDKEEEKEKEEEKTKETPPDPFGDDSTSDSSEQTFYEEESFDEFKEDSDTTGSVFDSDESSSEESYVDLSSETSFGSTESSFEEPASPEPYAAYYDEESSKKAKSNFTKIVIIGTLLFASIAIVFVFFMDGGDLIGLEGSEEEVVPTPEPIEETTTVDSAAFEPVSEPEPVEPAPTNLTPGEITTLEQQTGKSYVVIGSFFDGDLAMDFAKKLAENGNSPQIIPPFKDYRFYRVAIAEFSTFKEAEGQAPSYAEQFGREAWPLRY